MKVILNQDIGGVGRKYEVKNVADGYAANFLFPRKLAVPATDKAIERFRWKEVYYQSQSERSWTPICRYS